MFGQVETFDKQTRHGKIFTGDSRKLIAFRSDEEDWEPGALVQFDTAVVAVHVRKNAEPSPMIGVVNAPSDAGQAAAESFKQIDVPAYFGQYPNLDCGEIK